MKPPPELRQIHTMLRRLALPDEDHWNIPRKTLFQNRVCIDVHFVEDGTKFVQKRGDRGLGFLTKMAAGTRVERDVARPITGKAPVFEDVAHGFGFEYFMNGPECG